METADVLAIRGSTGEGSHDRSLPRTARQLVAVLSRKEGRHDTTRPWRRVLARAADGRPAVPA
ncbi:hypothetical protein [Streptosporangium vulgare]|uniref:Uncharacterized protein n=1 Tax=Streptosporangium vulgare TaxID=46190 RepID=A0ABV5T645_9ACTN